MNIDILIVAFYFMFLIAIGYFFQKYAANSTSDYFSGGGKMLWWMVGATAFMTQFSAMTFTGMAGDAFIRGWAPTVVFFANALGYLACYLWFAPKSRQLRIITPMEGMKMRFGRASEQAFTWAIMLPNIISAGVWLNALAIFVSAVFELPISLTILGTGIVVLLMSITGGAWAVIASDFMQMVVIMVVTIACAIAASLKGGGFTRVLELGMAENGVMGPGINFPTLFVIWFVMIFAKQFFSVTSLTGGAYRFFTAKDSENARKGALLAFCLMIIGPIVWFLPVWFMSAFHPDTATWGLESLGNSVRNGAYLAFVRMEMPAGMAGLMMAGIFAATMSSMDSALNRNAGIVVRNFYQPIINKDATEKQMMFVSKSVTALFGVLIIAVALLLNAFNHLSLFTITLLIGALLDLPILIPGLLGYFVKKTPDWAGWGTLLVGLCVSLLVSKVLTQDFVEGMLGLDAPLTARELGDLKVSVGLIAQIVITGGFFVSTQLFYKGFKSREREAEHTEFFSNLATPVAATHSDEVEIDNTQRSILGKLIFTFGTGIMLLVFVPNPVWGRVTFLLIGSAVAIIGFALNRASQPKVQETESVAA